MVGVDDAVARQLETLAAVPDLTAEGVPAYRRYRMTRSQTDLTAALTLFEKAASLAGPGNPNRPAVLNNLGLALFERSSLYPGRRAYLDRSVAVLDGSVATAAPDAAHRSAAVANLGRALLARRQPRDIERAAEVLDEGARLALNDPGERARRLNNLGIALSEFHLQSGQPDQLERAILAYEEAVGLTAVGSRDRPARQATLGTGLAERYIRCSDPADLDRAVIDRDASLAAAGGAVCRALTCVLSVTHPMRLIWEAGPLPTEETESQCEARCQGTSGTARGRS